MRKLPSAKFLERNLRSSSQSSTKILEKHKQSTNQQKKTTIKRNRVAGGVRRSLVDIAKAPRSRSATNLQILDKKEKLSALLKSTSGRVTRHNRNHSSTTTTHHGDKIGMNQCSGTLKWCQSVIFDDNLQSMLPEPHPQQSRYFHSNQLHLFDHY